MTVLACESALIKGCGAGGWQSDAGLAVVGAALDVHRSGRLERAVLYEVRDGAFQAHGWWDEKKLKNCVAAADGTVCGGRDGEREIRLRCGFDERRGE
jgi:hypothetical protein